ncbi:MAG: FtsX-like permease family protein [Pseudomonadota bacterium]
MFNFFHGHIFSQPRRGQNGYDLPLQVRMGTEFLVLLIAMMTYLLLLSAVGSLSLGSLASRWTSGLENTMTIEIPAGENANSHAAALVKGLEDQKFVKLARVLDDADMQKILAPWLGEQTSILHDLPLPVLVSVELNIRSPDILNTTKLIVRRLAPEAIVDAHEDWLNGLLKLTGGLRLTAMIIFSLILAVTAFVIAGAVRSRMAIHQRELELLHIMGASDGYISRQFVRYIFAQSAKGMLLGVCAGLLTLAGFVFLAYQSSGLLPDIRLMGAEWFVFLAVPPVLLGVGLLTARYTALSVLREMP